MDAKTLQGWLGQHQLGVAAHYLNTAVYDCEVYICGVEILADGQLILEFRKGHQFQIGDLMTIHLDNRTGVSEYDASLNVYRCSYKGEIVQIQPNRVRVAPVEYQLFWGMEIVLHYQQPGYQFPQDDRVEQALPDTSLTELPEFDLREQENKIGVLVSYALERPHTTVLAFLSSDEDDIFFITLPQTFKAKLLRRQSRCYFAIDSRAVFTYSEAIEWNYSLIAADAYQIPATHPLFEPIKEAFIAKNPWEVGFFSDPSIEMYHLKAQHVVCPGHALSQE
ncbi:hypothetical protein [Celerinatantimonas sp. YJH-8]|uniref:hypothetical protein n=1 Tax=Celerinatantimonas sp. YJH-8 TaxID=3228714 RepID=UPI0038C4AB63